MLNSPYEGLCWIVLDSPQGGLWWVFLSLEIRSLLDYAKQSTYRPFLDCAKKSGKQTFVRFCSAVHMQVDVGFMLVWKAEVYLAQSNKGLYVD